MRTEDNIIQASNLDPHDVKSPNVARLIIDGNKVIKQQTLDGLDVKVKETEDGVDVNIHLHDNITIEKPVHLCFGVLPEKGLQVINMDVVIGNNSKIKILGHCTFPNAVEVEHRMNGKIHIKEGADYSYFERHVHSESGGTKVIPYAKILIDKEARFKTEFELLQGRVGEMDIRYELEMGEKSLADMMARVNGKATDKIWIKESAELNGEYAKAILTSKVAVRDEAKAEVYNKITANAANSRGHVDCKEIVKDNGIATAIPIVDVRNAKAHVTHEAAVGDVDKKQLETLMSRGLEEDEASEIIIQGLLR